MTITYRSVKGSPLTNAEVDNNFSELKEAATKAGGTTGQIYTKQSNADYDAAWEDAPSGLPTATAGQIVKYDGTNWVADTQWVKNGSALTYIGKLGLNTVTPGSQFDIGGTLGSYNSAYTLLNIGNSSNLSGFNVGKDINNRGYFLFDPNFDSFYVGTVQNGVNYNPTIALKNGNVGFLEITPTQRVHINGNLRVTGAYYDSTNSSGTSGQALLSTATGTSWTTLTKSSVSLDNVDNTSDVNKPISTATQTALNGKQATLVNGTNIKTINSQSLLGSGNLTIPTAEIVVQDTAPATDQTILWRSTNSTATHPKNCLFAHNGAYWELVNGDASFKAINNINWSTTGAFTDIVFTQSVNNAGGTLSADGKTYTIGATGVYDIEIVATAGTNHTWTGGSSSGYAGVLANILIDGVATREDNKTDYGAITGSGLRRPLRCKISAQSLVSGQTIKSQYFMTHGTFTNGTLTLSVRRIS